jgi:hypothetical protein
MDEQPADWQPDNGLSQSERELPMSYFFRHIEEYVCTYLRPEEGESGDDGCVVRLV